MTMVETRGRQSGLGVFAAVMLAALTLGGCGDDSGSKKADAGTDAAAGGDPTQMCVAMAKKLGSKSPAETINCLCGMCLQQMNDCNDDEGCVEIRDCSDRTGCRGPNDCYLGAGLCRTEIDKWGSTSLSVTLSQQLADCNMAMCTASADAGTSSCPMEMVSFQGMMVNLPGCCSKGNLCGLMDSFITMSCIERSKFPLGKFDQQTCDGTPVPMVDAGSTGNDGGGDAGN